MNLRLLPLLGVSASALLALKLLGLTLGPESGEISINGAVAQETPAGGDQQTMDMPEMADGQGEGAAMAPPPPPGELPDQPVLPDSLEIGGSAAERAVLESLGRRRESLQQQEGQLDLREKLLKATEERIQKRVDELKKLEERIEAAVEEKKKQEENEIAGLVTMYENMKPKDAARIFDRLSLPILMKVVRQMKPRKMADILAKMHPEAAERLTVAIASNASEPVQPAQPVRAQAPAQDTLPKIPSN
ncbi:MotE family protein [Roseibium sp.]|uniref:MotE family protein n=1 Tax=Roseibium sp. TaxID=1936156 RepID=UPI003BAF55EB